MEKISSSEIFTFQNKKDIGNWLEAVGVKGFSIQDDLTVDSPQGVDIFPAAFQKHTPGNQKFLPVQFGEVGNFFNISELGLESLRGSPTIVKGGFYCQNNHLTSLVGAPLVVFDYFDGKHNFFTSLVGAPKEACYLDVREAPIDSLKGYPQFCDNILILTPTNPFPHNYFDSFNRSVDGQYELSLTSEQASEGYALELIIQEKQQLEKKIKNEACQLTPIATSTRDNKISFKI